ncbi:hypothetical protein AAZX31_15G220400 [Glycine max]
MHIKEIIGEYIKSKAALQLYSFLVQHSGVVTCTRDHFQFRNKPLTQCRHHHYYSFNSLFSHNFFSLTSQSTRGGHLSLHVELEDKDKFCPITSKCSSTTTKTASSFSQSLCSVRTFLNIVIPRVSLQPLARLLLCTPSGYLLLLLSQSHLVSEVDA